MANARHILLIGLRGSGKSTIGRLLAERLGCAFVDLDDRTPKLLGEKTVGDAFRNRGEFAFREAEARALDQVLNEHHACVIGAGGGTPTAPGAVESINAARRGRRCVVVYLRADASSLRQRLADADNAHRPSLTGGHVLDEIEAVRAVRDPLYQRIADEVVEVAGMSASDVAMKIQSMPICRSSSTGSVNEQEP